MVLAICRGLFQNWTIFKASGVGTAYGWTSFMRRQTTTMGTTLVIMKPYCPHSAPSADFNTLLVGLHARGIKLLMDLVVNHTSDEHAWFVESRKSRDNPIRDYYHWWPAEKGKPPHRYSFFDKRRCLAVWCGYQLLLPALLLSNKQPDLNWENPKVRQDIYQMMTLLARQRNRWLPAGCDFLYLKRH